MKIRPVVRKRVLANINATTLAKGKKGGNNLEFPVQIYVNDRGKVYYLSTGLTTTNPNMVGSVFTDKGVSQELNNAKSARLTQMIVDAERYALDHTLDSVESVKNAITLIVRGNVGYNQQKYLTDYIMEFARDGKHSPGTIKCYEQTRNKVERFDAKATLESVDEDWLNRFRNFCKETMSTNGLAIPMRNLRATFNWARKKQKITKNYPFEDFRIGTARVWKTVLDLQRLADLRDFPCEEWQERYRDYFMLQFYLCGIDIKDLCLLKKSQMRNGRLIFYRHKNEHREEMVEVNIPVCNEAKALIKKYGAKEGDYLLDCMDRRADYVSFNKSMNKALKKIGYQRLVKDKVGKLRKVEYYPLVGEVTTKTSRRTFGTIARRLGVPEPVVGMCFGHAWASSNTTQVYEWFDLSDVDKGVKKVMMNLGALKGRPKELIIVEIKDREGLV